MLLYNLQRKSKLGIFTIFLLFAFSCSIEKKIAKDFVNKKDSTIIIINETDVVYKENSKPNFFKNNEITDSTIFPQPQFSENIVDTALINFYVEALTNELKQYNIIVLKKHRNSKENIKTFFVNIAQFTFEESLKFEIDSTLYGDTKYFNSKFINIFVLHQWIEIKKLSDSLPSNTLYKNDLISDQIIGKFKFNNLTNNLDYRYKLKNITDKDIDNLIYSAAKKSAEYIYDYILNEHIKNIMINENKKPSYIKFKRSNGSFYKTNKEKFEVVK